MSVVTWTKELHPGAKCASANCQMPAVWRMESDGLGSQYCDECRSQIEDILSGKPDADDEPDDAVLRD
mgnify:CR=1 FL=1